MGDTDFDRATLKPVSDSSLFLMGVGLRKIEPFKVGLLYILLLPGLAAEYSSLSFYPDLLVIPMGLLWSNEVSLFS